MRIEAMLWEELKGGKIHCYLCSHHCKIDEDNFGFCGVRQNLGGKLYTYAYGKVVSKCIDPIEKKPLYHFLPGTFTYSIAAAGCNFRCPFCQNWSISQLSAKGGDVEGYELSTEQMVKEALEEKCQSISYTYTEPTIFFEYAYDMAKLAKERGLCNIFVTNGFMTKEAIEKIVPYLDAANIDLKFFDDNSYKTMCGGRLQPVLDSIQNMKDRGVHLEVTTLIIPDKNDSDSELRGIAEFLVSVDKNIPWHVSRFHPDYKHREASETPIETIKKAKKIGEEAGLKHVYPGNVSGL